MNDQATADKRKTRSGRRLRRRIPVKSGTPIAGRRVLKTVLAVTIAIWLTEWLFDPERIVFAGVAAMLAVSPSSRQSWSHFWRQLIGGAVGAGWGLAASAIGGGHPLWIGFNILLMFMLSVRFQAERVVATVGIAAMLLVVVKGGDYLFALERLLATMLGLVVGMAVNMLIWNPSRYGVFRPAKAKRIEQAPASNDAQA